MQRLGTVENAMGNQSTPSTRVKTLLRSPCRNSASWDGDQLAGLARVIDDGEMRAYMHWVLVNPKYQGMHVGSGLVERVKERYADYMFLEVMPEESKNVPFYQRHGFALMEDSRAMQIVPHP